jgi:hypothetical protein
MESNAPKINVDDFFRLDQLKPKQEEPETLVKNKPQEDDQSKDDQEEIEEIDDDQDDGDYVEDKEQVSFEVDNDDDDEDEDEEGEDEDPNEKAAKAEKKRRGFQSENAKLKAKNEELNRQFQQQQQQINLLMAQLNNPNVSQNQSQADPDRIEQLEELLSGDPDDYPTNATIKKILSGMKGQVKNPPQGSDMTPQKLAWMVGQPDYQEINEYANKFNLQTDPYFSGAATDEVGAFFGIRSKILQDKVNKLESQIKKMSKSNKKRKGKVPVTGSRGPANKGQANRSKKEDFWTSLKFN